MSKDETKKKNRWYDQHPELGDLIEGLKILEKETMISLLKEVRDLISNYDPELINRTVMQYPLTINRRWYDKDPMSWMVINALKFADPELKQQVIDYMNQQLKA